ncbi:hypothetical protein [Lactobacillus delbrueckii]|uniref:hypothetical protein n=1 Tax=Lactobacillus delbrueckii TaxID=1584 RepID=UPI00117FE6A5|nr:hypothetical protein [Lactobacillus delbrueckii]
MTAFTGVDSQNLPDVMVSVQFILAIGENLVFSKNLAFFKTFFSNFQTFLPKFPAKNRQHKFGNI